MRDSTAAAMTGPECTRRHPRYVVNITAKLVAEDDASPATLGNVALGGLYVRTPAPVDIGVRVKVSFRLVSKLVCEATGKVVWQRSDGEHPGFGVSYEEANSQMSDFTKGLGRLPDKLRTFYLADVLDPRVQVLPD